MRKCYTYDYFIAHQFPITHYPLPITHYPLPITKPEIKILYHHFQFVWEVSHLFLVLRRFYDQQAKFHLGEF